MLRPSDGDPAEGRPDTPAQSEANEGARGETVLAGGAMERRTVLKLAASGTAGVFLPPSFVRAFFQEPAGGANGDSRPARQAVNLLDVQWHLAQGWG